MVNAKAESDKIDNMGFALPVSNVKRIISIMKENGLISGGTGVSRVDLNATYTTGNVSVRYNAEKNVAEIFENVIITEAGDGLEAYDSVRHIKITDTRGDVVEDLDVTRVYHLDDALLSARSGYVVEITVSRNGNLQTVDFTVSSNNLFAYN